MPAIPYAPWCLLLLQGCSFRIIDCVIAVRSRLDQDCEQCDEIPLSVLPLAPASPAGLCLFSSCLQLRAPLG